MMRMQTPKYARQHTYIPYNTSGIKANVYSALGQTCLIVVRGLRRYNALNLRLSKV